MSGTSDSHLYTPLASKLVHPSHERLLLTCSCLVLPARQLKFLCTLACPSDLRQCLLSTAAGSAGLIWVSLVRLSDPFPYPPQDCYQLVSSARLLSLVSRLCLLALTRCWSPSVFVSGSLCLGRLLKRRTKTNQDLKVTVGRRPLNNRSD